MGWAKYFEDICDEVGERKDYNNNDSTCYFSQNSDKQPTEATYASEKLRFVQTKQSI